MTVIRIEVTNEDDAAKMVTAFRVAPALHGCDYEIWLVSGFGPGGGGAMQYRWRKNGQQGGAGVSNTTHSGGRPLADGGGAGGTGTCSVEAHH